MKLATTQFSKLPIPDVNLAGRSILVTGANSGLGLAAARLLLQLHCSTIVIACRSPAKGKATEKEILDSATDNSAKDRTRIVVLTLELNSFSDILNVARECKALPRLDAAVLNAGVNVKDFSVTEAGYETTLNINAISTFLLATLLVPTLRFSAQKFGIVPTISVVGSAVHFWAKSEHLTSLADGQILNTLSRGENAEMASRYNLTKLSVMLLVRHVASSLERSAREDASKPLVVINNVAPGLCETNLFRHERSLVLTIMMKIMGRTCEQGARTLVHGCTAGRETSGQYLSECEVKNASGFVRSLEGEKTGEKLWRELSKIYEGLEPGCISAL